MQTSEKSNQIFLCVCCSMLAGWGSPRGGLGDEIFSSALSLEKRKNSGEFLKALEVGIAITALLYFQPLSSSSALSHVVSHISTGFLNAHGSHFHCNNLYSINTNLEEWQLQCSSYNVVPLIQ